MAKLHDMEVEEYLASCVTVYPEALQEEFTRISADLAYWNSKFSDAVRVERLAELSRKEMESLLNIEKRETLAAMNSKVTETMVSSAVDADERLHDAKVAEIEAEVAALRIRGIAEAVRTKKDMLVSIGATVRAEMLGDPAIREMTRGRKMVDER